MTGVDSSINENKIIPLTNSEFSNSNEKVGKINEKNKLIIEELSTNFHP